MGMLQDLKWETLETIRRHARLSVMQKMYYGFLYNRERRTRGSHDFKFIVLEGHKDIFRFSLFPTTITEWKKLSKKNCYQSISLWLSLTSSLYQFLFVVLAFIVIFYFLAFQSWRDVPPGCCRQNHHDLDLHLEDILLLHIALIKEAVDGSRTE